MGGRSPDPSRVAARAEKGGRKENPNESAARGGDAFEFLTFFIASLVLEICSLPSKLFVGLSVPFFEVSATFMPSRRQGRGASRSRDTIRYLLYVAFLGVDDGDCVVLVRRRCVAF